MSNGLIDLQLFGEACVTLFVIMDPPGVIPIFLALTRVQKQPRAKAAGQAVAVSFGVIVAFAVAGQQILSYLGIEIPALQAAGGLLLLLVALELLTDKAEQPTQIKDVNIALVPLGTPLLAGPGAIVATIVFAEHVGGVPQFVALAAAIIVVHLTLYLSLRFSGVIVKLIKESGIVLVTRIAGLLLSAIAVQLVADGVDGFVRHFMN
jgi:multiple antibiotic resistance protein